MKLLLPLALAATLISSPVAASSATDIIEVLSTANTATGGELKAGLLAIEPETIECATYWAVSYLAVLAMVSIETDDLQPMQTAGIAGLSSTLIENLGSDAAVACLRAEL